MTISEMHTVFRVLNQQMGLHLVRGILPESIDVFINMEIQDLINRELMQNAIVETQTNSNYQSVSVSSINTFSTLHCKKEILLSNFELNDSSYFEQELTSFTPLFLLRASLKDGNDKIVNARIMNPDIAHENLNDYCSAPDKDNPIVTLCNVENGTGILTNKVIIYCKDNRADYTSLIFDYIKKPNNVSYNQKIDCDLPEHLHYNIVENAVKRFYNAISESVSNNKQNIIK